MRVEGFEVVRRIGRGGTGEVFEAVRAGPGGFRRPVALKRLYGDAAIRGDAVRRFFIEAQVLSHLDHPNIVRVLDVIDGDAGAVIVMELLRGATLAELAADARVAGEPLPWSELLAIADQALAGLAAAHAARRDDGRPLDLVHRDVTPRNLIVCDTGVVKLLDFGLAKLRTADDAPVTHEGLIQGTLELLAPEQARGERSDSVTDIYQLGATLYWALTGRFPHGTGTPAEVVAHAITSDPAPIDGLVPDLPRPVAELVTRAMARERTARFPSADAMRAAIAAAGGAAGPSALTARVARWRSRRGDGADAGAALAHGSAGSPAVVTPGARVAAAATTDHDAALAGRRRRTLRWAGAAIIGAAAVAIGTAIVWRRGATPARTTPREAVLTLLAGAEQPTAGAISPDGAWLYYTTQHQLMRKAIGGSANEPIALPDGFDPDDVEVLRDGVRVVVTGQAADGEYQTWLVATTPPRLVHRAPTGYIARVSADERQVAIGYGITGAIDVVALDGGEAGFATRVVQLAPGEIVSAVCWSPDGTAVAYIRAPADAAEDSIEIVGVADRAARVVHRRTIGTFAVVSLAWPDPSRLLYTVGGRDGAILYQVSTTGAPAERELYRWPGLAVQAGRWSAGRLVYTRGTGRYGIYVRDPGGRPTRVLTGDGRARRLAGWTGAGELVFAVDTTGTTDVVRQRPAATTEIWIGGEREDSPDTLAGDAVIFQRAGGDEIELVRAGPDGTATRLASVPRLAASASIVRCAGDRAPPCVVEQAGADAIRYAELDPATGAVGRTIATRPVANRFLRNHAVSPDGATLAVVDGADRAHLIAIADGAQRELVVGGGVMLQSIAWSIDGRELLVTGLNHRGHSFVGLALGLDGAVRPIEAGDSLWIWRLQPATDGRLASVGLDFEMELATLSDL